MSHSTSLPMWLATGLPVLLTVLPYFLNAFFPATAEFYFRKESGIVENITVILLLAATLITAYTMLTTTRMPDFGYRKFYLFWLAAYLMGCIYFLGEEISWGQHFFGWGTPDTWQAVNDQQETNLHNTSALFDQIPRAIITLGILIGGLIIPLALRARGTALQTGSLPALVLPDMNCVPAAIAVVFVSLHDKLYDLAGTDVPAALDIKDGEVKESLIALFILIYIAMLARRKQR